MTSFSDGVAPSPSGVLVCRFLPAGTASPRVGVAVDGENLADLTTMGIGSLAELLDSPDPRSRVAALFDGAPKHPLSAVTLLAPIDRQEVWAAGVTYLRSKTARMEESDFSATAYDRVYDADRPEIFFKSVAEKVVGGGDAVGIRADAKWNVPEPELALVMNSRGTVVGCAIGNDMSSRDIEGENLLYLPQAKTYDRSCAIGPWVALETDERIVRGWTIAISIERDGGEVFSGSTKVEQIKRTFAELAGWLWRSQRFPHGVFLLTGTGVVPDESFTLRAGDRILISISGIGQLDNRVVVV